MARLSFEQLAMNRTRRRSARIRKLIQDIGYDWFDSDIGTISSIANYLGDALDQFDKESEELFRDFMEQQDA